MRRSPFDKHSYEVGDRVVARTADDNMPVLGKSGKIVSRVDHRLCPYYVIEFDEHVGGHDGMGAGRMGHCWALPQNYLSKEPEYGGLARTAYSNASVSAPLTLSEMDRMIQTVMGTPPKLEVTPKRSFNSLTYRGIPVIYNPFVSEGAIYAFNGSEQIKKYQLLTQKKEGNMLNHLSAQLKRLVKGDEDLKALVELGVYNEEMEIRNPALVLDMLAVVFKKELAEEARTRLAELKEDEE